MIARLPSERDVMAQTSHREPSALVQDLPFEIREYATHYMQEQLYPQAIEQLASILSPGSDLESSEHRRIYAPSPQVIATLNTLVVYPPLTTRLPSSTPPEAANLALQYCVILPKATSTTDLPLSEALSFAGSDNGRPGRRRRSVTDSEKLGVEVKLTTKIANADSIFTRADDFWAVVGWAFNCSVSHPARWMRWRLWLDMMIETMAKDLADRTAAGPDDGAVGNALIARYLTLRSSGRGERRRMMRAILADGSKSSLAEFPALWPNETKPPKEVNLDAIQTKRVDIDNEQFGDYNDADEAEDEELPSTNGRSRRRVPHDSRSGSGNEADSEDDSETVGGHEANFGDHSSIQLRQRLLGLIANFCQSHPDRFVDLEDLFDIYTEFLRPLPLNIFKQFILPAKPYLDDHAHSALTRMVLRPILSIEAPVFQESLIDWADLVTHYLPFPANRDNATDNAKVSLLIEALMRLLWKHPLEVDTKPLRKAFDTGRKARNDRVASVGRRMTPAALEAHRYAEGVLKASHERMNRLLAMLVMRTP